RLQHSRVNRGDYIYRCVQLTLRHSRCPCVRKASLHSWITQPHHRDCQTDKHLLPLGEAGHGVGITIELAKVGFAHVRHSFFAALGWWSIGVLGLTASLQSRVSCLVFSPIPPS